jgi:hypothetical protein
LAKEASFCHISWFFRGLAAVVVIEEPAPRVKGTSVRIQMP